jgi:hypothetical protein
MAKGMRVCAMAAAVATIALCAPLAAAGPAGASSSKTAKSTHAAAPKRALEGHITFWECPSRTTEALIVVNRLTLHPGQPLNIDFIVRNIGTTACSYVAPFAGVASGPTTTNLQAGQCGAMGFEIQSGSHHHDVWPGPATINCPALGFAQIQPNATVSGTGTWSQTLPSKTKRVPVGKYTLVVDGHFSFPLVIDSH